MPQGSQVKILSDAANGWEELEFRKSDGQVFHGYANGKFLATSH